MQRWIYSLTAVVLLAVGFVAWYAVHTPADSLAARAQLDPVKLKAAYADIEQALNQGNNAAAKALAIKLTIQQPNDARAFALLSRAHLANLDRDSAYAAAVESLKLDAGDHQIQFLAGTLANQLRNFEKAKYHYTQAMMAAPSMAKYPMYLGEMLLKMNDLDGSQMQLLRAASLDAAQPQIHSLLAEIAARRNKLKMAIDLVDRAIDTAADSEKKLPYRIQKAQLLRADNEPAAALSLLQSLPAGSQLDVNVTEQIAQCHMMMSRPAKAAEVWLSLLDRDKTSVRAAAEAGLCFYRSGDWSKARQYLGVARRLDANDMKVKALGELLEKNSESK